MPKLTVDGIEVEVEAGATVLQACEEVGAEILVFVITNACPLRVIVECVWWIWNVHQSLLRPVLCLPLTAW